MALKPQHSMMSLFSMASMTDVIFLLLIFFMVTSTFVFPTALDITLPQSSEQVAVKPTARVFIDAEGEFWFSPAGADGPSPMASAEALLAALLADRAASPEQSVAIYADTDVTYGRLVEVLDLGARNGLRMVLATRPAPASVAPAPAAEQPSDPS